MRGWVGGYSCYDVSAIIGVNWAECLTQYFLGKTRLLSPIISDFFLSLFDVFSELDTEPSEIVYYDRKEKERERHMGQGGRKRRKQG